MKLYSDRIVLNDAEKIALKRLMCYTCILDNIAFAKNTQCQKYWGKTVLRPRTWKVLSTMFYCLYGVDDYGFLI